MGIIESTTLKLSFYSWLQEQKHITESTAYNLYQKTIQGFPYTTRRQHSIDPIRITQLEWIPYLALNTLYIRGLAQNVESETYSQSEYRPIILFKNVKYHQTEKLQNIVKVTASDHQTYFFEKLSYNNNNILVRCNCGDFHWRGTHANYIDKSLFGRDRKKYESLGGPLANPNNSPMLCKHLIKLLKSLQHSQIIY